MKENNGFSDRLSSLVGDEDVRPFARKCGVTETSIRNYLKGTEPTRPTMVKIARACNVTVGWLADGEGEEPAQSSGGDKEGINTAEGRLMTDLVLMSGTQYAEALWSNLKSFAEAVRKEAQVKELERKVEAGFKQSNSENLALRNEIAELKELVRAQGTQQKRDSAANA